MSGGSDRAPAANPGDMLRKIQELIKDKKNLSCHVVFALRGTQAGKHRSDGSPSLIGTTLEPRAFNEITSRIGRFTSKRLDWEPVKLSDHDDGDNLDSGSYHVADAASVPGLARYLKEPDDMRRALDRKIVASLAAVLFRLDGPGGSATFFRKFTPGKVITEKRSHFKIASGILDVQEGDVLDLPDKYDCCIYGGAMLIFNRHNFEDLFEYRERRVEVHRQVFGQWKEKSDYTIVDIDKYEAQTLKNPKMLRKFHAIQDREIYQWDFVKLRRFLNRYPVDGVKIDAKSRRISFKSVHAFLHLFNDAHLTSGATNRRYLATSKREEGGGGASGRAVGGDAGLRRERRR